MNRWRCNSNINFHINYREEFSDVSIKLTVSDWTHGVSREKRNELARRGKTHVVTCRRRAE